MSDPITAFIDALIECVTGAQDQTQADYALCGPAK